MEPLLLKILIGLTVILILMVIALWIQVGRRSRGREAEEIRQLRRDLEEQQRLLRQELSQTALQGVQSTMLTHYGQLEKRLTGFAMENEQKLEQIRLTIERRLSRIQEENQQKLSQMEQLVEEKLQKSLEERMTRSFQLVNDRLEQVYKGLGEMQNLAVGVGDLKKILSNVKSRGILGEVQLGAILEEILAPEQYETNVITRRGSKNYVEYAVKLPTQEGTPVYLPIDAKFPADAYHSLLDAYDSGSSEAVAAAAAQLTSRIRQFAKDVRDKYLDPPYTTEFAILFLPFEGLYAEAVNRGLVEVLQRDYRVNLAGPSTMAALLNSLQMGFRTFAIQKRSSEVWEVLGAVKTEFGRFAQALELTQQRLEQAGSELDKLVGVRTRQMQRKLKEVTSLPDSRSAALFAQMDGAPDRGEESSQGEAGEF